jgi:dynein heavy chain
LKRAERPPAGERAMIDVSLIATDLFYSHSLTGVIQDFKMARYNFWLEDLSSKAKDNGLALRLEKPLIRRLADTDSTTVNTSKHSGELVCNFDEDLISLFSEVSYWEKFQGEFTIPYVAHDLCNKKENLRIMRENVMLVVRAYNDIIRDLNADEKRLFLDHIRKLDRRIGQGMTKLTWQNNKSKFHFIYCVCF